MARAALALSLAGVVALSSGAAQARPADRIALIVVLVVDQLGTATLLSWGRHLDGGLAELIRRGAYYPNGVHEQANAATAPGHASIVTGAWPNVHGVVGNLWYDPASGAEIHCADDPEYQVGPARVMVPTIADAVRVATGGKSKTAVVSMKDRVAAIMGGHRPDAAVWYDREAGRFVWGAWCAKSAPAWVEDVNLAFGPRAVFGKKWERLRRDVDYDKLAGADDDPHETDVKGLGRAFPRTLGQGLDGPNAEWLGAYRGAPPANEAMFSLAREAFDKEGLGMDEHTDLLFIGQSVFDTAGHWWGPTSQETLDHLFRIDRALGALMAHVEKRLGGGKVLWVVTADHGATMTPETAAKWGVRASRPSLEDLTKRVNGALAKLQRPGKPANRLTWIDPPFAFLSHDDPEVDRLLLQRTAARALSEHPAIAEAYAPADLSRMGEPFRTYYERVLYAGREPDVLVRPHPYVLIDPYGDLTGTGHGSPYAYDTHVPIIFAGPGVSRSEDRRPYPITRVAPTIAALAGFEAPPAALEAPLPAAWP